MGFTSSSSRGFCFLRPEAPKLVVSSFRHQDTEDSSDSAVESVGLDWKCACVKHTTSGWSDDLDI